MKFAKLCTIAILALAASQSAVASSDTVGRGYFKIGVGFGSTDQKYTASNTTEDNVSGQGLMYNAGVGYYINHYFKTELEVLANSGFPSTKSAISPQVKGTTYGLYANGIAELYSDAVISPYALLGFGWAYVKPQSSITYKAGSGVSYQAGIGALVGITSSINLDVGFRYVGYQTTKYKATDALTYPNGLYTKEADTGVLVNLVVNF
jgi:opacity protein-like surface antigen